MSSRVVFGYSALLYLFICPVIGKESDVEDHLVWAPSLKQRLIGFQV